MSTPNPLIPQGTFQAQAGKGASNVRIAVATIVAIHVVFFGGLLLQGCKPTKTAGGAAGDTNTAVTNLTLPPIDSGALYYTNASHLPPDTTGATASNTLGSSSLGTGLPAENLVSPATNLSRTSTPGLGANLAPQDQGANAAAGGTGTREYTIVRGDTFGKLATANGTTVAAIRKANPTIDPAKLRPGMKIQIPAASATPAATSSASGATPAGDTQAAAGGTASTAAGGDSYTVKAGDTLTKIAKAHGITVSQLRSANNLKTSGLRAGQKLKIPAPNPAGTHEAPKHKVKASGTNSVQNPSH